MFGIFGPSNKELLASIKLLEDNLNTEHDKRLDAERRTIEAEARAKEAVETKTRIGSTQQASAMATAMHAKVRADKAEEEKLELRQIINKMNVDFDAKITEATDKAKAISETLAEIIEKRENEVLEISRLEDSARNLKTKIDELIATHKAEIAEYQEEAMFTNNPNTGFDETFQYVAAWAIYYQNKIFFDSKGLDHKKIGYELTILSNQMNVPAIKKAAKVPKDKTSKGKEKKRAFDTYNLYHTSVIAQFIKTQNNTLRAV